MQHWPKGAPIPSASQPSPSHTLPGSRTHLIPHSPPPQRTAAIPLRRQLHYYPLHLHVSVLLCKLLPLHLVHKCPEVDLGRQWIRGGDTQPHEGETVSGLID